MEKAVVLRTVALKKHFGGVQAVDGVDLAVFQGDVRAIIGPNGAGKTTLFNVITGEHRRDSGRVVFRGKDISKLPAHEIYRHGLSRTFQITSIFRSLTVLENVQTALLTHGRRHYNLFTPARYLYRDEALALLEQVGLQQEAERPSGVLSHGDQRRLELAIALASHPYMLMLDEPTAGMAPRERYAIMDMVACISKAERLTLLFTEHDMDVVFKVATRITVLHQGRVITEGEPSAVRANQEVQRIYLGEQG